MTADDLLVGDAEREAVAKALREHCADGRLSMDEFTERLDATFSARTAGELRRLTSDLPVPAGSQAGPPTTRPSQRRPAASMVRFLPLAFAIPVLWIVGGMLFGPAHWHGGPQPMHGPGPAPWGLWPVFAVARLLLLVAIVAAIRRRAAHHWAWRRGR